MPFRKEHSAIPDMPTPLTAKGKLNNNLRELSTQLDALDDLHKHLEWELKNSKLVNFRIYPCPNFCLVFVLKKLSNSVKEIHSYNRMELFKLLGHKFNVRRTEGSGKSSTL